MLLLFITIKQKTISTKSSIRRESILCRW